MHQNLVVFEHFSFHRALICSWQPQWDSKVVRQDFAACLELWYNVWVVAHSLSVDVFSFLFFPELCCSSTVSIGLEITFNLKRPMACSYRNEMRWSMKSLISLYCSWIVASALLSPQKVFPQVSNATVLRESEESNWVEIIYLIMSFTIKLQKKLCKHFCSVDW